LVTIVHGNVYVNGKIHENISLIIDDLGIIKKICKGFIKGEREFSFRKRGQIILPGMIDVHVHMRDFKESYKEDFYSGTTAAAAGGVTIIADMPNTKPPIDSIEMLKLRSRMASEKAVVDYGLYMAVSSKIPNIAEIEKLAVGIKVYPKDFQSNVINELFSKINGAHNVLIVFHAEDPLLIKNEHRPLEAEISGVRRVLKYVLEYNIRAHVTHVTNHIVVDVVKRSPKKITVDTCPHYLLLSSDKVSDEKYYRVNPPLRSESLRKKLFEYFISGKIDVLATDHAPHAFEEKFSEKPSPGFPGLETALPLMLTLVSKGCVKIGDVVRMFSQNPSKLLKIDKYVGSIAAGKYANLAVVDLTREYTIDPKLFFSKAKHSPFEKWKVQGKVIATFVRGQPVFINGEVIANKGYGVNIKSYGDRVAGKTENA